MIKRFEQLTAGVSRIYKSIGKIKKTCMNSLGLKGTHVMCIYYLTRNPDGLTASDLCSLCREDKAGISRILSDLERKNYIYYPLAAGEKKYRARAVLTDAGKERARKVSELILRSTKAGGAGLTDTERQIFYRALFKIADNLEQLCRELEQSDKKSKEQERTKHSYESTKKGILPNISDSI